MRTWSPRAWTSAYDPDPGGVLPVECLSLKVRTENEDAFNLAYDRCAMHQAERFSVFQGEAGQSIADVKAATEQLQEKLSAVFKGDKNSDRVLVRQYQEGAYTNFIVYHEKRTQAMLVFKGSRIKPKVSPTVLRPAQQDFVSYNSETGQVEIEARFEKEESALRKSFAECCFGDPELFEKPEAAQKFTLDAIACEDFALEVDDGDSAAWLSFISGSSRSTVRHLSSDPRTSWKPGVELPAQAAFGRNHPEGRLQDRVPRRPAREARGGERDKQDLVQARHARGRRVPVFGKVEDLGWLTASSRRFCGC
jgi:hypothetical protein